MMFLTFWQFAFLPTGLYDNMPFRQFAFSTSRLLDKKSCHQRTQVSARTRSNKAAWHTFSKTLSGCRFCWNLPRFWQILRRSHVFTHKQTNINSLVPALGVVPSLVLHLIVYTVYTIHSNLYPRILRTKEKTEEVFLQNVPASIVSKKNVYLQLSPAVNLH